MPAATETAFAPVELWNAQNFSENVLIEDAKDPAARKFARFVAGSYTAQTPEILAAIERAAPHVKRSNLPEPIECDGCGWKTKSLAAYQEHRNKHP